ncbi:MerR family transcriptional regulator [Asticcacaulis sp. 201]|uniref:MerR family transcriptional regulator n=1 Tax=Asticcacaulis sp. 201 TaxID=3028787 RepID=UPI0029161ECD|nr:MerR family transcriptional regulator [Asticcacaulis sp. 201]MDV6329291.1 MerR family transcriptional regulator [Asticcacaulis sp. 201]
MNKGPLALRTISEAADALGVPQHVLRFWETKFTFIRPTKRAGGRRFYRPQDIDLLQGIKTLLYDRGYTIRGVQKLFKEDGQKAILNPTGVGDAVATEQGLVSREEIAVEDAAGVGQPVFVRPDTVPTTGLSTEMRESFLNIAKALEDAQATLGRQIGKAGRRS